MKRLQVSIAAITLIVVACAMALTALRTASDFWLSALYTFTTVLLLVAVIAARFRRGNEKAFWFGFAVFGWGLFLLGYGPWRTSAFDPRKQINVPLDRNLITTRVILSLVPYLVKESDDLEDVDKITANTVSIAHMLVTLTLAIGGGFVAVMMRRRRGRVAPVRSMAVMTAVALLTAYVASSDFFPRSPPFFPDMVFGGNKDDSDFITRWYSEHLAAMGEPSLWMLSRRDSDATIYRLLWLPTFDHPVLVRIERTREGAKLRATVLNGMGGYAPGQIAIDRTVSLGADQFGDLNCNVEQAAFWDMLTEPGELGTLGMDGDQLIIEGVTAGKYHVVDRWDTGPAYTKLCRQMLDLSGLKTQKACKKYHAHDDQPEM
jgi:MFS family permease